MFPREVRHMSCCWNPLVQVKFVGMMQYDGDLKLPANYLVAPPLIERTSGEYLAKVSRCLNCCECPPWYLFFPSKLRIVGAIFCRTASRRSHAVRRKSSVT